MTDQHFRLPQGGRIDRTAVLRFTVDGRELTGHPGDTLASAMLANGLVEVAPSLYRGRPRGIVSAGAEEVARFMAEAGRGADHTGTRSLEPGVVPAGVRTMRPLASAR